MVQGSGQRPRSHSKHRTSFNRHLQGQQAGHPRYGRHCLRFLLRTSFFSHSYSPTPSVPRCARAVPGNARLPFRTCAALWGTRHVTSHCRTTFSSPPRSKPSKAFTPALVLGASLRGWSTELSLPQHFSRAFPVNDAPCRCVLPSRASHANHHTFNKNHDICFTPIAPAIAELQLVLLLFRTLRAAVIRRLVFAFTLLLLLFLILLRKLRHLSFR